MSLTTLPGSPGPIPDPGSKVTYGQALLLVGLTIVVLGFTGWMIMQGYPPHVGLLTAGGGVAVAGGGWTLMRGLKRLAWAWGQP